MNQTEIIEIKPRSHRPIAAPAERCTVPDCKLCAGKLQVPVPYGIQPLPEGIDEQLLQNNCLKAAMSTLEHHLENDPELAWGWHCNIAMAVYDCGGRDHAACNRGAARFLTRRFPKVDTTKHPAYEQTQRPVTDAAYNARVVALEEQFHAGLRSGAHRKTTPDLTLAEAFDALRAGKRITEIGWHPTEYLAMDADGNFVDEAGDLVDWNITFPAVESINDRCWSIYHGPEPDQTAPKTEDLTTVEAIAALAAGKRVRQVHPHDGGVWHLKDGYFRCSKGTVGDAIQLTATDLLHSRYRIEA